MSVKTVPLRGAAEVRLGRQRSPQHAEGPHMLPYLRAANVQDGTLDLADVQLMNFDPPEQATFSLKDGDVLVTEGSGSLASVGASAVWHGEIEGTVCFQNTLLRLRPRQGVDGRFLEWWARSTYGSGVFASVASGANIYHLSAERVRALPMHLPPLEEQRRIADFLDAETRKIDSVRSMRNRQMVALVTREASVLHRLTTIRDSRRVRLRNVVAKITSGPRGWGEFAADRGSLFIRITNIPRSGIRLDLADSLYVDAPTGAERERTRTRWGDVLVSITADIGSVAIVDDGQVGANVSQHVALLRPIQDVCNPRWLAYSISAPRSKETLRLLSYGGTKVGLGLQEIADLAIDLPAMVDQERRVREIDRSLGAMTALRTAVQRQLNLLGERRQALVTAAVTGQLDVPTAKGVVVS